MFSLSLQSARLSGTSRLLVALLLTVLAVPFVPAAPAEAVDPWQQTLQITFPTDPRVSFSDTYEACRSGCARTHQAADLMGQKMWPLYSTVDGTICSIDEGEIEDSYGRNITVCGPDGVRFRYLHVNNDTPGTDDGAAPLSDVYAPGITRGSRVAAGQLIAYMGDSGNAEGSSPHLHFDIFVPGVVNPYGEERINPYHSLMAALAAGRVSDGTAVLREPTGRLSGASRVTTAIAIAQDAFDAADTVLVASSLVPHDALVAGPLAAVIGGPVLLSDPTNLDPDTVAEIERLGASHVLLIGQAKTLADQLGRFPAGVTIETIGSNDRFATSAAVAEMVWQATGAVLDGEPVIELPPIGLPTEPAAPAPLEILDWDQLGTFEQSGTPTLVLQLSGDRWGPSAVLDGATFADEDLSGDRMRVWLAGVSDTDVESVTFVLDGQKKNTEREWPHDLGGSSRRGATGIDLPALGNHTLEAIVTLRDASTSTVTAHFAVSRNTVTGDGTSTDDGNSGGGQSVPARRAIVAKGMDPDPSRAWPDALAASWYGAARRIPVLLTASDGLPRATANALDGVTEVVVAGGAGAISEDQAQTMQAITGTSVTRLSGSDRYATASAIAQDLLTRRLASSQTVHVATGINWPDAVTAGAAIARQHGVLLLVDPGGVNPSVRTAIRSLANDIDKVVALGGISAVPGQALSNVAAWAV